MTWATLTNDTTSGGGGEIRVVDPTERTDLEANAVVSGFLLVAIEPPRPALRGRLALLIESSVEEQLERRGAPPPGVSASSDLDASLSDQLYRARLVGGRGLAISLHSLEGIANLAGALDAEDSAVLRWWIAATRERPVRLLLSAADRSLGVYSEPVTLASLLSSSERVVSPPRPAPEVAQSAEAMQLSGLPPEVTERALSTPEIEDSPLPAPAADPESDAEALMQAMAAIFAEEEPSEPPPAELLAREEADETPSLTPPAIEAFTVSAPEPEPEPEPEHEHEQKIDAEPEPAAPVEWQKWTRELETTRGPKPLAVVERTFVTAYVPLCDAISRGLAGEEAAPIASAWSRSFEKSYSEAFDALRVRGKRPTMVLDVPDLALRIARLHGARSAQLVLVDGMRFDLGLRVNERLKAALGRHAALTERMLLWSALPSTTAIQLELIGRGPQGLREIGDEANSEVPVARGRGATTLRRIRAGHREVLKLDLVESAISVPGGPLAERLDDLADETANALAQHISKLPARTLVMVFGDHGFAMDALDGGTGAARSGGASPEEVLVPAFAWLAGAVH